MQQIVIYWYSVISQYVSGIFMPIIRRSDCIPLPIVVCPVIAVVMLESRVARCVHCVENVACIAGNILSFTYLSKMHGHSNIKLTFYISLTVHLGIILVNKQLDEPFSVYLFISLLYMFRAGRAVA